MVYGRPFTLSRLRVVLVRPYASYGAVLSLNFGSMMQTFACMHSGDQC